MAQRGHAAGALSPDERVQSALEHWSYRFLANGVDYGDFRRAAARIETWDQWCQVWSAAAAEREELGEQAEREGHLISAADHYVGAALLYHFAKFLFVHDPNQLLPAHEKAVACYRRASEWLNPPAFRVELAFGSGKLAAYVRHPAGRRPRGLVLLLPGLDSVKEEMHALGETLLQRGLSVCAMDGPGQGEAEFSVPIRPDYESAVAAVLDALAAGGHLDAAQRIGVVGISLGGYYAARAVALEGRVQAGVWVGGFFDFGRAWSQLPELSRLAFRVRSRSRDDAEAEQKARALTLEGVARRITRPFLVVHGGQDRIAPPEQARLLAAQAPGARLFWLDEGNHVCNNFVYRWRPYVADWLAAHLGS